MIKVLLLIFYLYDGQIRYKQAWYDEPEQCAAAGQLLATQLSEDDHITIIDGGCYKAPATEATK